MAVRFRLGLLVAVVVLVGTLGSAFIAPSGSAGGEAPPAEQLIRPTGAEGYLWPYTSRSRSVDGRTLALNVVIVGSPDDVRVILRDRSELEWTPANESHELNGTVSIGDANESALASVDNQSTNQVAPNGSVSFSPWQTARGASRYSYVANNLTSGEWVEADYQLATGTYLGSRTHIRAYPGPADNWTALQAHTEYWDWFRLRHTVTGTSDGAVTVENDLRDEPFVTEVNRVYHGYRGGGSDGWLSVIRITSANWTLFPDESSTGDPSGQLNPLPIIGVVPAAALVAVAAKPIGRRDLRDVRALRDLALPLSIIAVVLGVRSLGLAAEVLLPPVNPKVFAGLLYPVLAVGPLVVAGLLAQDRPATRVALFAAGGLGAAFVLDFGVVGVNVVPIQLVVHRTALLGVLGLFAYGIADDDYAVAGLGAGLWFLLLVGTLFGVL